MTSGRASTRGRAPTSARGVLARSPRVALAAALAAVALAGCSGPQSALDPRGPQAASIATLWWLMLAVSTVVLLAVTVLLLVGVLRARRAAEPRPLSPRQATALVATGGVAVPVVVLVALLIYSVGVNGSIGAEPPADALTAEVVGHQWWWEIRYLDAGGTPIATTANELHLPVGEPVRLKLLSRDVIHSFWVPNLQGKTDLIPGQVNESWVQADEPGEYRGQCAEFCGLQHAKMAFVVVAEPAPDFRAWLARQQQPAREPEDDLRARGRDVFVERSCVLCHTVRGTVAHAKVAPDLTHVASRRTLAAGTLPNTRGHLAAWILDPQRVKPGNRMPPTPLDGESLHALLAYLEGLA